MYTINVASAPSKCRLQFLVCRNFLSIVSLVAGPSSVSCPSLLAGVCSTVLPPWYASGLWLWLLWSHSGTWNTMVSTKSKPSTATQITCYFFQVFFRFSTCISLNLCVCMHAKSLQLCLNLCNPRDCSPPGSSVHGILQARILEWVAMPSSRGSSQPRDGTHVSYFSCIGRWVFTTSVMWESLLIYVYVIKYFN